MLVEFGRGGLLEKARQQPDRVKQVLAKVRTDGLTPTVEAVRAKLDQPIPLGYCNAGIVRGVGAGVSGFEPGERVVTNGPHAEYVRVPWTLAARVPDAVSNDRAAFAPIAAIGLQGLRLAQPTLGETVVVYGLGLIGLLTVQLAKANGCRVIGIDRVANRLALAESFGAETVDGAADADLAAAVLARTGGVGADAVLLTLATSADEPVRAAAAMSRKRGRIVLVGVTGLGFRREDFYEKELSFQVSAGFGPGRYDPRHEEGGVDYPLPYVRWTEGRNFAAVLGLMAEGRVDPLPLVTHRFGFEEAPRAYDVITGDAPGLGIVLEYVEKPAELAYAGRTVELAVESRTNAGHDNSPRNGVTGFIGSGNYASRILIPAFRKGGAVLHTVASSGGTSGAIAATKNGFQRATTDLDSILLDDEIDTVVIATRHDSHADLVVRALGAGKHVFVEKPLALHEADVERVEAALAQTDRILCVGFNRRLAPLTLRTKEALRGRSGPLAINITVNAGALPDAHWAKTPAVGGGRLVGEACHFVDLARCLTEAPIQQIDVVSAANAAGLRIEDISIIRMSFEDGSIATIQYLANGPSAFPKERVEVFWEGKALRIDNWRKMEGWGGVRGTGSWPGGRQDKGQDALAAAMVRAVRGETPPPIPREELIEVAFHTVRALSPAG